MHKIILFIITCSAVAFNLSAQQQWTLEDCINHAIQHNLTIQSTELSTESQKIRLEQAKNQRLPSLDANMGSSLNFGTGLNDKNVYVSQNSANANMGLNASVLVFSGFRVKNNIESQKFATKAAEFELKKAKESLSVNIASAYLQALYNKEQLSLANEQVRLSQISLERSQSLAEYGKIPEGQVYEAKAQLSKDQYNAIQSKNTLKLSLLELAQMLEIKEWEKFDISTPAISMKSGEIVLESADDIYQYAVKQKSEVKASEYRLLSSEKNVSVSKAALYPTISLGAGYSNRYYNQQRNVSNGKIATLFEQLDVNGGSSIGLNMSIPIFSRFDNTNNIRLSKQELERAKIELESTKKVLQKEIQQAWFNAVKALENHSSSIESLDNAKEAYRFAEEKYNNGKSTLYEYNQAKVNLATVQSNLLQAKYNLLFCMKILDFYKGNPIKL